MAFYLAKRATTLTFLGEIVTELYRLFAIALPALAGYWKTYHKKIYQLLLINFVVKWYPTLVSDLQLLRLHCHNFFPPHSVHACKAVTPIWRQMAATIRFLINLN